MVVNKRFRAMIALVLIAGGTASISATDVRTKSSLIKVVFKKPGIRQLFYVVLPRAKADRCLDFATSKNLGKCLVKNSNNEVYLVGVK